MNLSYKKKSFIYGSLIFLLAFIPIFSQVFDYQEWDESQYVLASYYNYNFHSYLQYQTVNKDREIKKVIFPYPNILYSWTFGAFNKVFHLPTNHNSRMKYTIFISLLLTLLIIICYFVQYSQFKNAYSILLLGLVFYLYLIFTTLWKVRNAQLGALLFFSLGIFFLLMSYKPNKIKNLYLYELLATFFLILSLYYKEQLLPILLIFPWFLQSRKLGLNKIYRSFIFYLLIAVGITFWYIQVYQFSIHSGFNTSKFFYASEASHWLGNFSLTVWITKLSSIPLTYYTVGLLGVFIGQKDYKKMKLLENKFFITGMLYFIISSILYFYQGPGYISAINYIAPVLFMPYILNKAVLFLSHLKPTVIYILVFVLFIPIFKILISNYYPLRGKPIIIWLTQKREVPLPCMLDATPVAVNIYTLAGNLLTQNQRNNPVMEYKNMDKQEFIDSLEKLQPEILFYYNNPTEYPVVDEYMKQYKQEGEILTTTNKYILWIRESTPDTLVFIKQVVPHSKKIKST